MDCFKCGKPVTLAGDMSKINGCFSNPAPDASAVAAPSVMLPAHWKCIGMRSLNYSTIVLGPDGERRIYGDEQP